MRLRKSWRLPLRLTLRLSGYMNQSTDQGKLGATTDYYASSKIRRIGSGKADQTF